MAWTYASSLKYLYSLTNYEKMGFAAYAPENYNLARFYRLLALLDDPHRGFQSVHVAGTKGKGSTAAMIESVLRAGGYRTALYTSPHLHTFRERIQTGGVLISEADVTRLMAAIRPLAAQVEGVTTFEVMTALAFAWFVEQEVDWAVVEVGLGGRLDATNVVRPAVAVITSISLDHTLILGDTLALIAAEKAGIVKPGVPVVSAPQRDEALAVIEAVCAERGAPLTRVGGAWDWRSGRVTLEGQSFDLVHGEDRWDGLWIPLVGEHQLANAASAVAALSELAGAGVRLTEQPLRAGLAGVVWPGRFEVLSRAPLLVADSAHNGDSARRLAETMAPYARGRRLTVIIGASHDHATPELFRALLAPADRAVAVKTHHPRAADPEWLQDRAAEAGLAMEAGGRVAETLDRILAESTPDDVILCAGSVFVAAEARAAWFKRQGLPSPPTDPVYS